MDWKNVDYNRLAKMFCLSAIFVFLYLGVYTIHGAVLVSLIKDITLTEAFEILVGENLFLSLALMFGTMIYLFWLPIMIVCNLIDFVFKKWMKEVE